MNRAFLFSTLKINLFRISSRANQKRVTSKFLVAAALFAGLLGSNSAHADSFFDIFVDLWNSGDVVMSPVDSGGAYPYPPPPLTFPDLLTAAGPVDIELVSLRLRSRAPMLVSPPDPTGTFAVDSFFDIYYEIVATDDTGVPRYAIDSFFDVSYSMEVTPVSSTPDEAQFDIEVVSMALTGFHPVPLNGGGTINLGLQLLEGQPAVADGHVTVLKLGGGGFAVDSFFDVFVELSVDGGSSYHPSQEASQLRLLSQNHVVPEPASSALFAVGLVAAACASRRRKS